METKKLKLYSLNKEEYPDIEVDCVVIDDMAKYASCLVSYLDTKGIKPAVAKKTSRVTVRDGAVGELVDTRPRVRRNGKLYTIGETLAAVKVEGSKIVCNPDGEEYILKPEKFAAKYNATETPGVYEPVGDEIKYIICPQDITFMAPWGEEMYAVQGASLNISSLDDIYAIQNEAFDKTYTNIEVKEPELEK